METIGASDGAQTGSTSSGSLLRGVGLCAFLLVAAEVLLFVVVVLWQAVFGFKGDSGYAAIFLFFQPGLVQWVFVLPAAILLRRRRPHTVRGLLITAGIATLVNVTCAGLLIST